MKVYLIKVAEPALDGTETFYWKIFDTLEEAASEHEGETVYQVEPKSIGRFKVETKAVRIKPSKVKR